MSIPNLRRWWWPLTLLASSFGVLACGGKVVLDGEFGAGGEGSSSVTSSADQSSASTGTGLQCVNRACSGLGTDVCFCQQTCGSAKLSAECAPNEESGKLQCICVYDDVFSGICYEEKETPCDMDRGCCAEYFQGI